MQHIGSWLIAVIVFGDAPSPETEPAASTVEDAPTAEAPEAPASVQTDDDPVHESPVDPEPSPDDHTVGPATRPLRSPTFPEPRPIAGRDRRPTRRATRRFTTRPPLVRTALRVAPGFSARLTGRPYAAFGFDALASVMLGLHGGPRQWGLAPELGYALRAPGVDHQLLGGLGLLYGINAEHWTIGWLPRAVMQPTAGRIDWGMRNGLWFDFAENGFSIELSHQWLRQGTTPVHELRLTLGLDLAMLALVFTDLELAWL